MEVESKKVVRIFGGYALSGIFFILFSFWWTTQMLNRFYSCRKLHIKYVSTVTFPCTCLCGKLKQWPTETILKLLFTFVGFFLEIYTGFNNGKFIGLENGLPATMFFVFGLTGVVDLLLYFKKPLPKDTDYGITCLAFLIEALLFKIHVNRRNPLDVLLHTLLIYSIVANVLAFLAEMKWRNNILISLTRSYFTFLQGTWLMQVGVILYNPLPAGTDWNPEVQDSLMLATMYYTWHCVAVFLAMLCVWGAVLCFHRLTGDLHVNGVAKKGLIRLGDDGNTLVTIDDDSDDAELQNTVSINHTYFLTDDIL